MLRINVLRSLLIIGVLVSTGSAAAPEPGFKVVVHAANPESSISKDRLSNLFLKRVTRWDNGDEVVPVDQPHGSSARQQFSQEVLDMTRRAVKSYWQRMVFSGRLLPPVECSTDTEVLEYVRSNVDAIGYVSSDTEVGGDVKVVRVVSRAR